MRQSKLPTKTIKESISSESRNANLLTRAGYIYKVSAGAYAFLPLGLRSLNKIIQIIREEMNNVGGQEVFLTSLQNKDVWEKTDRWDNLPVWFKTSINTQDGSKEVGFAWTHEEPISEMMAHHISSHKDLPVSLYQFQTKFRNELRAKSGLLRTREFIMKDLYTFCKDKEQHDVEYEKVSGAYSRVFERVGLGHVTYKTFASGGDFAKFSHEFQSLCDVGEDIVYLDEKKNIAINKEVLTDEVLKDLGVKREELVEKKAIEVGNIFTLGTRFSEALSLKYKDEDGKEIPVFMGSYGIGPARLLGSVVEVLGNDNSFILPESIAPYKVHLISIEKNKEAEEIYGKLGDETLFDDRDISSGEKFNDADLIGIPNRVIISEKSLSSGGVEYEDRISGNKEIVSIDKIVSKFV